MRRFVIPIAALFLLVGAFDLSATTIDAREVVPQVTAAAPVAELPVAGELRLSEVRVEQRTAEEAATAQFAQRGSFWWLIGVIVVAGVILALVLD